MYHLTLCASTFAAYIIPKKTTHTNLSIDYTLINDLLPLQTHNRSVLVFWFIWLTTRTNPRSNMVDTKNIKERLLLPSESYNN
ncbi:unnamed protein product [Brassica rapa]|uniref:Uncharacterized protein n=2 Tax=Brassica TaxID=3705 RepID=A0A8D9GV26_BRACM|nr:unnamed protein product [Brassica napus]CAG7887312.1 unnamed protein product [Brassica rapa]